jgi:recombinational DNA repair protein (RecF pathway)
MLMLTRTCSACKTPKPIIAFSPEQSRCKACKAGTAKVRYRNLMQDPARRQRFARQRMARWHNAKCGFVLRSVMSTFRYSIAGEAKEG